MSSSDSGDQASARGMSLLLLIPYSWGFIHGHLFSRISRISADRENVGHHAFCTYVYTCVCKHATSNIS